MGPEALAQVLRPLVGRFHREDHPDLLVGLDVSDDAAIFRINEGIAVIQTLDFFPPVVDDPYDYGAIAAVNGMSDVFAKGGEVEVALNICAFPEKMPEDMISAILRGGADKIAEAGGVLAGGHTINNAQPLYGLAVMGLVPPDKIWTKGGARPGDALVLTKPLGVGMVTTALKGQVASPAHVAQAVESMKQLNQRAARAARRVGGVRACTDITGFGLLGHAYEMASRSPGVRLRLQFNALPMVDGAMEYAEQSLFPGGSCRNRDAYARWIEFRGMSEEMQMLLFTPETSGGLLMAVAPEKLEALQHEFEHEGQEYWLIGEVISGAPGIEVFG